MTARHSSPSKTSASGYESHHPAFYDSTEGPVSPVASFDPARDELFDSWRTEIRRWIHAKGANGQRQLRLHGIQSRELLEGVWQVCVELGTKPRYEWIIASHTLTLNISDPLHEIVGGCLSLFVPTLATAHLRQAGIAPCGIPSVLLLGSSEIELKDGSAVIPSGLLRISLRNGPAGVLPHISTPLVLETVYSQFIESAQQKACRYLHFSGNSIRTVIICSMTYLDPRTPASTFRAEINIWVRHPAIHGLNPCQQGALPHAVPLATATAEADGYPEATGPEFTDTAPDGTLLTIRRRNAQPIILLDESLSTVPPAVLRLHAYDFVLPCVEFPNGRVPKALEWIDIPLEELQESLQEEVAAHRAHFAQATPDV